MKPDPEPYDEALESIKEECDEVIDLIGSFNYAEALDKIATIKARIEQVETAVQREVSTELDEEN